MKNLVWTVAAAAFALLAAVPAPAQDKQASSDLPSHSPRPISDQFAISSVDTDETRSLR